MIDKLNMECIGGFNELHRSDKKDGRVITKK